MYLQWIYRYDGKDAHPIADGFGIFEETIILDGCEDYLYYRLLHCLWQEILI